jgi:AcrR family transcriptional regulator
MGRRRAFDTEEAIRAARRVFWSQGFETASLPALEEATGLSASSIYNAFGSKRGLFDAAVASYLDEIARPRLRPLTGAHVEPGALVGYLTGLRAALTSSDALPGRAGCLLINSAGAPIGDDEAIADTVAAYCRELRAALGNGVRARLPDGETAACETLADACAGLVVAAFAVVRVDPRQAARFLDAACSLVAQRG